MSRKNFIFVTTNGYDVENDLALGDKCISSQSDKEATAIDFYALARIFLQTLPSF